MTPHSENILISNQVLLFRIYCQNPNLPFKKSNFSSIATCLLGIYTFKLPSKVTYDEIYLEKVISRGVFWILIAVVIKLEEFRDKLETIASISSLK